MSCTSPRAPVLVVGQVDLGARVGVELERAGVQRLALEVGRQEVLADAALGVLADDGQRVRVLRGAGLVDQLDDLDRLLDLHVLRHVHEHAAGPERGGGGGELALVDGQALAEVLGSTSSGCSSTACSSGITRDALVARRRSRRCWRRAARSGRRAARRRRGARARSPAARRPARSGAARARRGRARAARWSRSPSGARSAAARARRPRARPCGGLRRRRASRHSRPPPRARTRSPCPRARRPARGRPRGRSGRRA